MMETCPDLNPSEEDESLKNVPTSLWATHANEVRLLLSAEPVHVTWKKNKPFPSVAQYPLSRDAERGIQPVIDFLLQQGVLAFTSLPCNTPILPVKKEGKFDSDGNQIYRFVQDLRAINSFVIPRHPVVPNPTVILTSIPADAACFTVVDLCSAFFSIPLHPDSQFLFTFTFKGRQFTWTRIPQGYCESPSIFSQVLKADLDSVVFTQSSTLVQYVDDLLLCNPTKQGALTDSLILLKALAERGHKASRFKLQWVQMTVTYLGHEISQGIQKLTPKRLESILSIHLPKTKKQLRQFLGAAGYCCQWIPNFAALAKPLYSLLPDITPEPISWPSEALNSLEALKISLSMPPALGLPNFDKPFHLYCHENNEIATGILGQSFASQIRPIAYFSCQLDPVASGMPPCLRAVAAAATRLIRPILLH